MGRLLLLLLQLWLLLSLLLQSVPRTPPTNPGLGGRKEGARNKQRNGDGGGSSSVLVKQRSLGRSGEDWTGQGTAGAQVLQAGGVGVGVGGPPACLPACPGIRLLGSGRRWGSFSPPAELGQSSLDGALEP